MIKEKRSADMRCFKLIVMLFFLNLFLNCARNSSESTNDINENKRPSRFVKLTGLVNYRIFKSEYLIGALYEPRENHDV